MYIVYRVSSTLLESKIVKKQTIFLHLGINSFIFPFTKSDLTYCAQTLAELTMLKPTKCFFYY